MKKLYLLSVTIIIVLGCHVVPPPKEKQDSQKNVNVIYTFAARINDVYIVNLREDGRPRIYVYQFNELLNRSDNAWIAVGFDANWAAEMTILETQGKDNIFKKGEDIVFVIHSPMMSFATPKQALQNKTVKLDLHATILKDNMIKFSYLHLHK